MEVWQQRRAERAVPLPRIPRLTAFLTAVCPPLLGCNEALVAAALAPAPSEGGAGVTSPSSASEADPLTAFCQDGRVVTVTLLRSPEAPEGARPCSC